MDEECKPTVLLDIWRTCSKIRAATSRSGFDLWSHYLPLDPDGSNLISEGQFVSVLEGLRDSVGLSEHEILSLTNHFKAPDGRVLYKQFCQVVQNNGPKNKQQGPLQAGLEWEDAYNVNSLSIGEERRVMLLLTKIAALAKVRGLVLLPHLQDYETIVKKFGTVTISHFARILHFLKILVTPDEFQLLVRKFLKDGCTLNGKALVSALETVSTYLEHCGIINMAGEPLPNFQARALMPAAEKLPRLSRPETSSEPRPEPVVRVQNVFYTVVNNPRVSHGLRRVLERVRRHLYTDDVKVGEFFREFDPTNCGRLPEAAFRRCLATLVLGDSGTQHSSLTSEETDSLVDAYRDPLGPSRCLWKKFEADVRACSRGDGTNVKPTARERRATYAYLSSLDPTSKSLCKTSGGEVEVLFSKDGPPQLLGNVGDYLPREEKSLPRPPHVTKALVEELVVTCEDVLRMIKDKLLPEFDELDKSKNGHLGRQQFRQVLQNNHLLLTEEQLCTLEQRYLDELGFNYLSFVKDADPVQELSSHHEGRHKQEQTDKPAKPNEKDITSVLGKIKERLVCYPARISQFMSQFDLHNQLVISRKNFVRGLDDKLELTTAEKETIMEAFASPTRPQCVEYKRFCDSVEKPSQSLPGLLPLQSPYQHVAHNEGEHNFLNFQERRLLSAALEKMAAQPTDALLDAFREVDICDCGTVNQRELLRVLTKLCLHTVLSTPQFESLKKCFSKLSETSEDIDYRALVNAIEIQKRNGRARKA